MSLLFLQTHDLSWQDRTINMELMMAPARSQLLYNKHKGLKTKCEQVNYNLEREKDSFLKSYKTDMRMMERRKELYSKRRNDIILRRSSGDNRKRSSSISFPLGRISAPPRLELEPPFGEGTFITEFKAREYKSAGERRRAEEPTLDETKACTFRKTPEPTKLFPLQTPELRTDSPCASTRSPTPGKPYLLRNKSVRFLPTHSICPHDKHSSEPVMLSMDERIKRFMDSQEDFNKREPISFYEVKNRLATGRSPIGKRVSGLSLNLLKLEDAFNEFCEDNSTEGLDKLVKYASRMKATMRNARNSAIIPRRGSVLVNI